MENVMKLYIICSVVVFALVLIASEVIERLKFSKIGEIKFRFSKESQKKGLVNHFIRAFVMSALLIYFIVDKGLKDEIDYSMFLLIPILSLIIISFIKPIITLNKPYGIYENGAVTVMGTVLYSRCKRFGINKSGNGENILVFQSNLDFFGGGSYLYIKENEYSKYRKFLTKKCELYSFGK